MLPLELCTDGGRLFRFGLWATGLDVHQKCECLGSEPNRHHLRPLDVVQPAAGSEPVADNPDQCWSIYLPPIWRHEWPHSLRAEHIHPALRPNLMEKKSINKCCYEAVFGFMVMMKLANIFPGLWRWMMRFKCKCFMMFLKTEPLHNPVVHSMVNTANYMPWKMFNLLKMTLSCSRMILSIEWN